MLCSSSFNEVLDILGVLQIMIYVYELFYDHGKWKLTRCYVFTVIVQRLYEKTNIITIIYNGIL